jgi:hypothetical protein
MNSKKASRSRGVRTWPIVVLRRRVLGGCACAGDRILRGDGRGLVWLWVQVQVLGPLRGGEVGGGRCEGATRGGRGDELRLFVVGRAEWRAARLTSPAVEGGCCCARHPEMHICRRTGASAACAAREKGVGVIVPGARVVWEGRRDESPKYLLCVVVNTHLSICPTNTSSPRSAERIFHRKARVTHSTARPRRRRGRLPASSFPRQPLGPIKETSET